LENVSIIGIVFPKHSVGYW